MDEVRQSRQWAVARICLESRREDNQAKPVHLEERSFKKDLNRATKMIDHQAESSLLAGSLEAATQQQRGSAQSRRISKPRRQSASSRSSVALSLISFCHYYLIALISMSPQVWAQQVASFPGVSRDLASFCSARPSLSIDLASMVVHVKKSTSFNYKLYLFSSDNYVFQTGQIVPRDDFRIHSFPVKLKPFNEFLPADVPTYQQTDAGTLAPVSSSKFNAKAFFSQVPISLGSSGGKWKSNKRSSTYLKSRQQRDLQEKKQSARTTNFDVLAHGDILPGDESSSTPFGHHDVALAQERQAKDTSRANSNVHFDRDDQVAVLGARSSLHDLSRRQTNSNPAHSARIADWMAARGDSPTERPQTNFAANQQMVTPVGAFSSFHVNTTYLVRKDFDQPRAELVRLQIDPYRFSVTQVHLLDMLRVENASTIANATQLDDLAFLKHRLLSDPNTRITSINQIYEDWITRNFYTVVYIQRRLEAPERARAAHPASVEELDEMDVSSGGGGGGRLDEESDTLPQTLIVNDRLIFRGSSLVLLGADQLDYEVKASAFITEKNGLHYYFEFLTQGKFYLGAIDWSRRPFAIIDAQRFPLRQTKTKFDNEELLLCPPSVCYSDRPIDELVSYGRLGLPEKLARQAAVLTRALSRPTADQAALKLHEVSSLASSSLLASANRTVEEQDHELSYTATDKPLHRPNPPASHQMQPREIGARSAEMISLDELVEAVRTAASQLELRMHLRDWTWTLPRSTSKVSANKFINNGSSPPRHSASNVTMARSPAGAANDTINGPPMRSSLFGWHFEWARRNDIKVTPDTYGFVLTGHEIDASYRVYDELHLISANHLISISYTLANETVTSAQPIGDEFQGLSSSLLDPITGAFYDRYANQLYFFKGDRYVGYDYATKRPLEDFLLPPAVDALVVAPSGSALLQAALGVAGALPADTRNQFQQPLVSSLPVVGILGRQHYVDAIWHDLHEDLVYVFAGPKFYALHAGDFRDGAFRMMRQPAFRCINVHFLEGCRFDEAFPNPCQEPEPEPADDINEANEVEVGAKQLRQALGNSSNALTSKKTKPSKLTTDIPSGLEFDEEQQMKLRSIASRGRGFLEALLGNTLAGTGGDGSSSGVEPLLMRAVSVSGANGFSTESTPQERMVIYLLIAMVLITIAATIAMLFVVLNWGRARACTGLAHSEASVEKIDENKGLNPNDEYPNGAQIMAERIAYPPAISQYLSNQYHHHQLRQPSPYQQQQYARRQQMPLNYIGGHPTHQHTSGPERRQGQPPMLQPPQSQLFRSLGQLAKAAATSPNRQTTRRYDNLVDSSAL